MLSSVKESGSGRMQDLEMHCWLWGNRWGHLLPNHWENTHPCRAPGGNLYSSHGCRVWASLTRYQAFAGGSCAVPGVSGHAIQAYSGMKQEVVGRTQRTEWKDSYFHGSRRTKEQVGENEKDRKYSSSPKWKIPLEWGKFPGIKENGEKIAERWLRGEMWILDRS